MESRALTNDQQQAKELWEQGVKATTIARALHLCETTIRGWPSRYGWTRHPTGPRPKLNLMMVAMARKLWKEGTPRAIIAVTCQIGLTTLDTWCRRGRWGHRRPGNRPEWTSPVARATVAEAKRAYREQWATMGAHAEIERTRRRYNQAVRWRCDCGTLHNDLACSVCRRIHPLAS